MLKNLPAYIRYIKETGLFMRIVLATQGDFFKWFTSPEADAYFNTIKPTNNPANPNFGPYQVKIWRELMKAFFGPDLSKTGLASLDSLLGMEKSKIEAMEYGGVYTIGPFQDEYNFMEQNNQTVREITFTVNHVPVPIPSELQTVVLVISP